MPSRSPPLKPCERRRRVPPFQGARLGDAHAAREAVGEDLVEDGVADPVRAAGRRPGSRYRPDQGCGAPRSGLAAGCRPPRARLARARPARGPVEPRMMRRVSRILCSGRSSVRVGDHSQQQPGRLLALLADRLVDGRQRRVRMRGHVQVVEADDAQVLGHAQAHLARGPHDADGHHVAHGQDGRRPQAVLPDAVEGGHAAVEAGRPDDDPLVAELDAAQLEALAVAGQTARGHALGGPGRVLEEARACSAARCRSRRSRGGRARAGGGRPIGRPPRRSIRPSRARAARRRRPAPSAGRPGGSARPPGWSSDSPTATNPSTVARPMARTSEPWSGETKSSP